MASTATVLDHCRVSPPSHAGENTLPLTHFDVGWIKFHPIQRLLFFKYPCSRSNFLDTIVPSLKTSLSQTLHHFLPMAGNLIYPLDSQSQSMPEFRYTFGDSVSLTVAEANHSSDFDYLTGDSPRNSEEFYAFFSELPHSETETETGFKKTPVLSVQVTLFPESGFCIAFNTDHAIGDASSIVAFIKAWSFISKHGNEETQAMAARNLIPFYDRSVVKDPKGLTKIYWDQIKNVNMGSAAMRLPINKVRATYILHKDGIEKLKSFVEAMKPDLPHLSSFTVTSAYVWSCLGKSAADVGESVDSDHPEYFTFAVDARRRVDPPISTSYFGNFVFMAMVELTHEELKGETGFLIAAERISNVIANEVNNKENFMKDSEKAVAKFGSLLGKRVFGVAGSPMFDLYDADFGWGNPVKYEAVAIDGDGSMSLSKSRVLGGGLEIGLSMPKNKMDAFSRIFSSGLEHL